MHSDLIAPDTVRANLEQVHERVSSGKKQNEVDDREPDTPEDVGDEGSFAGIEIRQGFSQEISFQQESHDNAQAPKEQWIDDQFGGGESGRLVHPEPDHQARWNASDHEQSNYSFH